MGKTALAQLDRARQPLSERELSSCSMDSIGDEPLAALVIDGVRKFRETIPAIIELRKRFSNRPRGKAGIAGCRTWTEFCEKRLGRTARGVRKAIAVEQQAEAADAAGEAGQDGEVEASTAALAPASAKQNSLWDLLSTVQKAIRRKDDREAGLAALQLDAKPGEFRVNKNFGGQMWSTFQNICVEDIGPANPGILLAIESLHKVWLEKVETNNPKAPWRLYTLAAVELLCNSPKSRKIDHMCFVLDGRLEKLRAKLEELEKVPQPHPIPEDAHNGLHTATGVGKSKPRALADFIVREDAALTPRAEGIEDPYREEILEALREAQS